MTASESTGPSLSTALATAVSRAAVDRIGVDALSAVDAPAVIIDAAGRIIAANPAWDRDGARVGENYLTVCDDEGPAAARGIRAVLAGRMRSFVIDYPSRGKWWSIRVAPLIDPATHPLSGGPAAAIVSHHDITGIKQAEAQFQATQHSLHPTFDDQEPIFLLLNRDLSVKHVSPATREALALGDVDRTGNSALDHLDPLDVDRAVSTFSRVVAEPGARSRLVLRMIDDDGRAHDLDLVLVNMLDDPEVAAIVVTGVDVTESRRHQIASRLEARLIEVLPVGIIVTDDRGVVTYWNDRATAMYGFTRDEALGRTIHDLGVGPADEAQAAAITDAVRRSGRWEGEYEAPGADGIAVPVMATLEYVQDAEIGFSGIIGASLETTDRRRLEADLAFQARHDPLTGLPNRRQLVEGLDRAMGPGAAAPAAQTAVLFIDIDDFKDINDTAGHATGDEVLVAFSGMLTALVRDCDTVARLGGDEFVVCCEGVTDPSEALAVAERILDTLALPGGLGGRSITASIGVALSGQVRHGETLLRNADVAMYLAKENGKARVQLFDDALHDRARKRHAVTQELAVDLLSGLVETHYQPQIDLRSGTLRGFEALVRWRHSQRGLLAPDAFLDEAEESGLIVEIGRHVLGDACHALARWRSASRADLEVAVNVSVRQLVDTAFPATVEAALAASRIPPARLCLEVTEHTLMDGAAAIAALQCVKELGVTVAIDDFGIGYSSLGRLRRFPVDYLKVDRSFVDGLGRDLEDEAIVAAVVSLAKALGLRVVVEGIETEVQLEHASRLGCEIGQGYYWGRPVTLDAATALASGRQRMRPAPVSSDHVAVLHRDDAQLIAALADHVRRGVAADSGVLVIATPEHRAALAAELAARGIDVAGLGTRYLAVDAAETLDRFLVDGSPDPARFRAVAMAALGAVGAGTRPVCAYGEMVGLLWESGNCVGALQLEGLWEQLGEHTPFSLLCGYRVDPNEPDGERRIADACSLHHGRVDGAQMSLG